MQFLVTKYKAFLYMPKMLFIAQRAIRNMDYFIKKGNANSVFSTYTLGECYIAIKQQYCMIKHLII